MRAYRRASTTTPEAVWPNREALLACVGTGDNAEKVVRSCARLAAQLDLPWHAVHVETPEQQGRSTTLHPQVERTLKLAQQLGAVASTVLPAAQPAQALVRYAREHNLVRMVMVRSARRWPWQTTLADQVGHLASDLDLLQVGTLPLIVHGLDRPEALMRLKRALSELIVDGIDTTIPLFHALLAEEDIQTGNYSIHWLEKWLARDAG